MVSLLEVAERAQKGPIMEEKAWDLGLFAKATELTKKYDIAYPGDGSFFNTDDALVDRAFEAALDFLEECGVYCVQVDRVIKFTRQEVLDAVREAPDRITVGEGDDQRVMTQKKIEGREKPNHCPGHHAPWSQEMAPQVVRSFAQIPTGDYLEGFNFTSLDGREVFGPPLEAYAGRWQLACMRQAVRDVGRPGMALAYYPITTRGAVLTAPIDPQRGLRPTDGVLLSVHPSVKVETDMITAAIIYEDYGCFVKNGGGWGTVGGFAGGPEGAAIEGIAKAITGRMVYGAWFTTTGVGHIGLTTAKHPTDQAPPISWANSVACQAVNARTNIIYFGMAAGSSGPGTEQCLLEYAFRTIQAVLNGGNVAFPRQARAKMNASQTPVEANWMMEIADATMRSKLTRRTAQPIMEALRTRLEALPLDDGLPIEECYDLDAQRPKPNYERVYLKLKDYLTSLGMDFG